MKKKFSLWLNIVTICLCVCAIMVGVYAATSAKLAVSGQIGFQAHGIDMNVTAYMYGHAISADGDPIDESEKVSLIGNDATSTEDDTQLLTGDTVLTFTKADKDGNYPPIYFSDMTSTDMNGKPDDIVIEITLSATTSLKFDVLVTPTGTSNDDSILITPNTTGTIVKYTGEATETTKTIIFTLSLQANENGVYSDIANTNTVLLNLQLEKVGKKTTSHSNNLTSSINVSKFTPEQQETIRTNTVTAAKRSFTKIHLSYAERFPYYINFGTQGNGDSATALRWLIVGVDDGNGQITTLSEADKMALEDGYMIGSRDYYLLSENILYTESTTNYNISFQNQYSYELSSPSLNAYGVNANDYATSTIRAYLNGATVNRLYTGDFDYTPNGTEVTFYNQGEDTTAPYTFKVEELNMIKSRSVTDLYKDSCMKVAEGNGTLSKGAPTTEPEAITNSELKTVLKQTSDKFWLLSMTEVEIIFGEDFDEASDGFASAITTVQGASTLSHWWLRSPNASSSMRARAMYNVGVKYNFDVLGNYPCGARAAFKI